jgi:hypothetical protein
MSTRKDGLYKTQFPDLATIVPNLLACGAEAGLAPIGGIEPGRTVIGRTKHFKDLEPGEQTLLDRLPNRSNPRLNWKQNSGVLRQEI